MRALTIEERLLRLEIIQGIEDTPEFLMKGEKFEELRKLYGVYQAKYLVTFFWGDVPDEYFDNKSIRY